MQITRREVLFSVIIVVVLLVIGFLIASGINVSLLDKYQEYDTALQIDNDKELFEYGMRTDIGNAFVYGTVQAVDPVTYPEIGGKYSHVEKVKERYTMHTRVVTYTDGKGHTHTRTETYWTWDVVDRDYIHSQLITFLGVEFKYDAIGFECDEYITTIKESSHVRYKYYGSPISATGTVYTELSNHTINHARFYSGEDIESTIKILESKWQLVVFWFFWILLMIGAVIGFYYFENRWLEDKH